MGRRSSRTNRPLPGRGLALAAILGAAATLACGPAAPRPATPLVERLAAGVFMEYGATSRLGEIWTLGELADGAVWAALPVDPIAGWLPPTRHGWHPVGRRASLELRTWGGHPPAEPTLHLQLHLGADAAPEQSVEVLVGGSRVGRVGLERGLNDLSFAVEALAGREVTGVELVFDPPLEREGFGVPPCILVGVGLVDGALGTAGGTAVRPDARTLDGESLHLTGDGWLVAPLDRPDVAARLELELRCAGTPSSVRLEILDRLGVERGLAELDSCAQRWRRETMALEPVEGSVVTLSVEVLGDGGRGGAEIRRVRWLDDRGREITAAAEEEEEVRVTAAERRRPGRPPDIVLVILDAARAGHFGFAGYERDTTPNLDRLAAEALVFERAFAECANTSCSIPNLITGIPFMNLGTVFHGKKIPDDVTTLAEYLRPLGYRTVSFSANPNNAVSRNSHQGFDRFERLAGAHYQAEQAVEVIEEQPDEQPLYLQLHFLPPHQPYMPSRAFDLFTDPRYDGVVRPRLGLRRYSAGLATFGEADLAQLVALYDGNLRMVDDAVEVVFEALRRTGRWSETLVVVTSDHGEAFGEHGTFQHNSTVFDEMLHVPLVVRLPGGEMRPEVETRAPAALADVVPTVLGYLGIEPRPEVWGIDLLAPRPPGAEPRYLFHRTHYANRALLAIRDARWKAITGQGLRRPELYDLDADPGELVNLASRRPAHFSGLALRLRDFLVDWEQRVPRSVTDVELSSEEVELLRSLGYVE
jgi:arylsulfatase